MGRQSGLQALTNIAGPIRVFIHFTILDAIAIFHEAKPLPFEAALRKRFAIGVVEYIRSRHRPDRQQHSPQFIGNRNKPIRRFGFQSTIMRNRADEINVPLNMNGIVLEIEIFPAKAQRFATSKAAVVQYCQEQAVRMAVNRHQDILVFLRRQRSPRFLLLRLRADQGNAGIAFYDAVSVSTFHNSFQNPNYNSYLRFTKTGKGIHECLQFGGPDRAKVAQAESGQDMLCQHRSIRTPTGIGNERLLLNLVPFLGVLIQQKIIPDRFAADVVVPNLAFLLFEFAHGRRAHIFVDRFSILINAYLNAPAILSRAVFSAHGITPFMYMSVSECTQITREIKAYLAISSTLMRYRILRFSLPNQCDAFPSVPENQLVWGFLCKRI